MQRVLVQVPLSQAFVCPECAGPLKPPIGYRIRGQRNLLPIFRIAVLLLAMSVSLGIGYAVGRVQDRAATAALTAANHAQAGLEVARGALGLDAKPVAKPAPPPQIFVADRPYPAHPVSVDLTNPAVRLPREARSGQVTIDCMLEQPASHPSCQVTDVRGADAFSEQALTWLQSLDVRYAPTLRNGTAVPVDHRWRVVLEDFSGVPRRSDAAP